jgi:hypothetical protein
LGEAINQIITMIGLDPATQGERQRANKNPLSAPTRACWVAALNAAMVMIWDGHRDDRFY